MNHFLEIREKTLIFPEGEAPFHICHASNICRLRSGELIAAWFAGEKEGSDDIAIWMSRTEAGRWRKPICIAHDIPKPHWNPVLYERVDGTLLLFYKVGREISEWYTALRCSTDGGHSFSQPRELVAGDRGGRGPVRCKVITLSNGDMLAGTSLERGIWTAYADRSRDGGETWQLSNPVRISGITYGGENTAAESDIQVSAQSFYGRGVIQPTLWEDAPGQVHMLLRSSEGAIYRADSTDYGSTFGDAYRTELPNNNSGIDVVRCDDGLLVLCLNPVAKNWGPRTPIVLMVSTDNGVTWQQDVVLEDIPGEYSYPCVIQDRNALWVTYTFDRKSIACVRLERK